VSDAEVERDLWAPLSHAMLFDVVERGLWASLSHSVLFDVVEIGL
jgi:hypothetical protein